MSSTEHAAPALSVVVPTKDRAELLRACLESIRVSLHEADVVGEVIVVDDGSSDHTREVAASFGAVVLDNRATGVSAGRNTGIEAASTDLLLFLDDDDAWLPEHVRLHLDAHAADASIGVSYTQGLLADQDLRPIHAPAPEPPLPAGMIERELLDGAVQSFTTFAVRRAALDASGLFDESISQGEDFELVQRLGRVARFAPIEVPTVLWRQHLRPAGGLAHWRKVRSQDRLVQDITLRRGRELGLGRRWQLTTVLTTSGWSAHQALSEAERCLAEGMGGEARKLLFAAVRTSPVHVLPRPRFWRNLVAALRA